MIRGLFTLMLTVSLVVFGNTLDLNQIVKRKIASQVSKVEIETTRALMTNRTYTAELKCPMVNYNAVMSGKANNGPKSYLHTFTVTNFPCADTDVKTQGNAIFSVPSMTKLLESDFVGNKTGCRAQAHLFNINKDQVCYDEVVHAKSLKAYLKQREEQFLTRLAEQLTQDARQSYMQIIREPQFQQFIQSEVKKLVEQQSLNR